MTSEEMGLVPPPRLDHGLGSPLVFQDEGLRFSCGAPQQRRVGDPAPKTRELSGFLGERYFQPLQTQGAAEFRRSMYAADDHQHHQHQQEHHHQDGHNWNGNGRASSTPSGDGSDEEDEEDDDDEDGDDEDVDEGEGEVPALVVVNNKNSNGNNTSEHSNADTIGNAKSKPLSSYYVGPNRALMIKEGNAMQSGNDSNTTRTTPNDHHQHGRVSQYQNAVTLADSDGDLFNSPYIQGPEGSGSGQKEVAVENGCGSNGRKEGFFSSESGESLRAILSDPLTGALMDDAMILPCGHSFGGGGVQQVIRMKACYTCSQPVSEESVSPNLSLRAAVQAFRREEELQVHRSSKRRRDRFEQDKVAYGDSVPIDHSRGRGVQFPFAVTDRVIIKGNKRTPQRFVGREAIVTTQCLNGWYVVKTLDNAESVKLQYRSLAKVSDSPSSEPPASKMAPNWL
ncbi:U-box domain-containing protein 62 isoform X2 [Diospyros lotus]|uniref:U-box domain-containing protein 62 isoform X2 n=1 Tax=Diospyros lotus TaxID=55363 RepID=UPI00224DEB48|nr:U-box domain-containing protein 62 isoform X2 [Diospyros lotus]